MGKIMGIVNYTINNYCTVCKIRYPKSELRCIDPNGCGNRTRMSPKKGKDKRRLVVKQ